MKELVLYSDDATREGHNISGTYYAFLRTSPHTESTPSSAKLEKRVTVVLDFLFVNLLYYRWVKVPQLMSPLPRFIRLNDAPKK